MDKRAVKIMICCTISTLIVMILFIVAFKSTQPTCELVFIEPAQLRNSALASWAKEKPLRSMDKTFLIKFAGYLEYNLQPLGSDSQGDHQASIGPPVGGFVHMQNASSINIQHNVNQVQGQATGQVNQQPALVPNQQQLLPQNVSSIAGRHPDPSLPQSGFTNQQLQNSSFDLNQAHVKREKRFMPLELTNLEVAKLDFNRTKYVLTFNCSTITMFLVRKADRIFFDQTSVELKLSSKGEFTCDLQWPNQQANNTGLFGIDAQFGWAHYYCDRPLQYGCYHRSSKTNQTAILLAELHIHAIEFELGMTSKNVHKKHDFAAPRKECDL